MRPEARRRFQHATPANAGVRAGNIAGSTWSCWLRSKKKTPLTRVCRKAGPGQRRCCWPVEGPNLNPSPLMSTRAYIQASCQVALALDSGFGFAAHRLAIRLFPSVTGSRYGERRCFPARSAGDATPGVIASGAKQSGALAPLRRPRRRVILCACRQKWRCRTLPGSSRSSQPTWVRPADTPPSRSKPGMRGVSSLTRRRPSGSKSQPRGRDLAESLRTQHQIISSRCGRPLAQPPDLPSKCAGRSPWGHRARRDCEPATRPIRRGSAGDRRTSAMPWRWPGRGLFVTSAFAPSHSAADTRAPSRGSFALMSVPKCRMRPMSACTARLFQGAPTQNPSS